MDIRLKAVACDNTKIIYRSSLSGIKDASGTGNQKAEFITIGDMCEIDAEPAIDLETNNIQASHSVTVSNFSDINKFYASLHGLQISDSQDIFVEGFLNS